ncbi:uncharacterized protein EI90DRAFT_2929926, partial [Cantharellus anzutake]|uniref:uncharacterized protein n=1 Tax=Cantharellus anzutake TaxID=1750568 RepID=UPI00190900D5
GCVGCSCQAEAYGNCIHAAYQDARRGMCAKEFAAFKDCVQEHVCAGIYTCLTSDTYG